jgi:hypothetical protein
LVNVSPTTAHQLQIRDLSTKNQAAETELDSLRHQSQLDVGSAGTKLREKDKRIAALEEELTVVREHADGLDRMLRDTKSKVCKRHLLTRMPRRGAGSRAGS